MAEDSQLSLLDDLGPANDGMGDLAHGALTKHSARYVQERNPKLYAALQVLITWGVSDKEIAAECLVSRNLVAAIREKMAPASLEHHKKIVAALERVSLGAALRIADALDAGEEINPGQLAIILGITVEKLQLLKGGVTQRVGVVDENPERRMIREALQRSLSQGPPMVFGAGKELQNAATALPPPSAVPCPPPIVLEADAVHIQSTVSDSPGLDSTTL